VDDLREYTHLAAVIPDAGRVWWRAQMRMRREAVQAAGSPITAAQVVAFACAVGLVGACFGATSTWFQAVLKRVFAVPAQLQVSTVLISASGLMAEWGVWILLAAAVLLLLPAGICYAVLRD
jgi:hypothetical protein